MFSWFFVIPFLDIYAFEKVVSSFRLFNKGSLSLVNGGTLNCAMIPGLVIQGAKCEGTLWHWVWEMCDVSSAQVTVVHSIDNCVIHDKHFGGTRVAAGAIYS